MPYILSGDRHQYDEITWRLRDAVVLSNQPAIELFKLRLARILSEQDIKAVDGHFNYFITKLMLDFGWQDKNSINEIIEAKIRSFLFDVAKEVYPPKYFNYNRFIGMLACCQAEFWRRYKSIAVDILLIKLRCTFYDDVVIPYEDKKIKQNGDVE